MDLLEQETRLPETANSEFVTVIENPPIEEITYDSRVLGDSIGNSKKLSTSQAPMSQTF